jgi:hypothetical protein
VPISAGQMRNRWFPIRQARYAATEELKDINAGKINVDRDSEFIASKYAGQLAAERRRVRNVAIETAKKAEKAKKKAAAAASKKNFTVQELSVCASMLLSRDSTLTNGF